MTRIAINDLLAEEKELTAKEMGEVAGGRIGYRRWRQYRHGYGVRYRYVTRRVRVKQRYRIVWYRNNVTAFGTNYGRWHRAGARAA